MLRIRLFCFTLAGLCLSATGLAADFFGENIVDVKLTLPKGDTYLRGTTDPVANLSVEITLTNTTKKENLTVESVPLPAATQLSAEELTSLEKMAPADRDALVEKKKSVKTLEQRPINQESLGVAYVEPRLGVNDTVRFVITKLPEEGETVPEGAKPVVVEREVRADFTDVVDRSPTKYLAAGETSPAYSLAVGRFYRISEAGLYSIKVIARTIPNSSKPDKFAESNEEKFRVLPFKTVPVCIETLKSDWNYYERGPAQFEYQFYQVTNLEGYDEIYIVKRNIVRGSAVWEWQNLCTVKSGTQAQVAFLAPKKYALLAVHRKGDAGLFTVDFSGFGVKTSFKAVQVKDDTPPRLKVEAGAPSVE